MVGIGLSRWNWLEGKSSGCKYVVDLYFLDFDTSVQKKNQGKIEDFLQGIIHKLRWQGKVGS